MADTKRGTLIIQPGLPLRFVAVEPSEARTASAIDSAGRAIADSLSAYTKAARVLLEEKYPAFRESAPLHMREPCSIFILECVDGIFVRYDFSTKEEAKIRFANTKQRLAEIAPTYSDQLLHFPDDPSSYAPPSLDLRLL